MIETDSNDSRKPAATPGTRNFSEGRSPEGRSSEGRSSEGREGRDEGERGDRAKGGPMEVIVDHSVEKAIKILKRKLIKEGLFKELKARRYYEKPSERKKRKTKESLKKARKEEARAKKNNMLF